MLRSALSSIKEEQAQNAAIIVSMPVKDSKNAVVEKIRISKQWLTTWHDKALQKAIPKFSSLLIKQHKPSNIGEVSRSL